MPNPEQLSGVPEELKEVKPEKEEISPRDRLTRLQEELFNEYTEEARKVEILENYRELLKVRDSIKEGERDYEGFQQERDEETWEGIPLQISGEKRSMSWGKAFSPMEYVMKLDWAVASYKREPTLEQYLGESDYIPETSEQAYQEFLKEWRSYYSAGAAKLFGFGNAALEGRNPEIAVHAYKEAEVLEHENVVRKLEEYAKKESDPVRRRQLAGVLNWALKVTRSYEEEAL